MDFEISEIYVNNFMAIWLVNGSNIQADTTLFGNCLGLSRSEI